MSKSKRKKRRPALPAAEPDRERPAEETAELGWIDALGADSVVSDWVYTIIGDYEGAALETARAKLTRRGEALGLGGEVAEKARLLLPAGGDAFYGGGVTAFSQCPYPALRCGAWEADDSGVRKGNEIACSHPILPLERRRDSETGGERIRLAFRRDTVWRDVTADAAVIASQNAIIQLARYGVIVNSQNSRALVAYIADVMSANDLPVVACVRRLGWMDGEFIPFRTRFRFDGDEEYRPVYEAVRCRGSAEQWRSTVREAVSAGLPCRLLLAASCASALVGPLGINSFIVHLWGTTGVGKTVALMMAASVWGDPKQGALLQSLNATRVGLERKLAFLHDLPLIGDELQIIKDHFENYDRLIMFVTEGSGKSRGTASGGIEAVPTWNNLLLSSGEEPITTSASGGGAKNRCVEMECRELLFADGHAAAECFREHYGHFGPEFLRRAGELDFREMYGVYFGALAAGDTTEKQAMAMAALLTADRIIAGLLELPPLAPEHVSPLLTVRSEVDAAARAHRWVMDWASEHQDNFNQNGRELWGAVRGGALLINRAVLEREMTKAGFSLKSCLAPWHARGLIQKSGNGRFALQTTLNGFRTSVISFLPETEPAVSGNGRDVKSGGDAVSARQWNDAS